MTMLDRYLHAVRVELPKRPQTDDIVAEIAESLHSQIEERERSLGRPLTDDEEAALIKAYGRPQVVAARYGPVQFLIGPDLFPFYWTTLRSVLALVVAAILLAGAAASIATRNGTHFFNALNAAFNSIVWVCAIVTIAFAAGERFPQSLARRIAERDWDPRSLPPAGAIAAPRSSSLAEFVANILMLLVLLDARGAHYIPLDAVVANMLAAMHVALTQAWLPAYYVTIGATALLALSAMALFLRPSLSAVHESVRGITSAAVGASLVLTLQAGRLIAGPDLWNTAAVISLVAALLILLLQIFISVRALLRARTAVQS